MPDARFCSVVMLEYFYKALQYDGLKKCVTGQINIDAALRAV